MWTEGVQGFDPSPYGHFTKKCGLEGLIENWGIIPERSGYCLPPKMRDFWWFLVQDMLKFKEDTKLHSEWMEMPLGENPWGNRLGKWSLHIQMVFFHGFWTSFSRFSEPKKDHIRGSNRRFGCSLFGLKFDVTVMPSNQEELKMLPVHTYIIIYII